MCHNSLSGGFNTPFHHQTLSIVYTHIIHTVYSCHDAQSCADKKDASDFEYQCWDNTWEQSSWINILWWRRKSGSFKDVITEDRLPWQHRESFILALASNYKPRTRQRHLHIEKQAGIYQRYSKYIKHNEKKTLIQISRSLCDKE